MSVARTEALPDGRRAVRALAGPFEITRLSFPASFAHGVIDPPRGYVVVLLEGAVCKTFRRDEATLAGAAFACVPAGAAHSSVFARCQNEVLIVRPARDGDEDRFGHLLRERRHVSATAAATLGRRMAGELAAHDSSASLALEGLALQLLATAGRAARGQDQRAAAWLRAVRELLHDRVPEGLSLHELGDAVGRHPAHVARAFRREHGVTVAQYVRALRLEWAAGELAAGDVSVARIASDAGFADQSHFTRAFRAAHGVTPGRYRRLVRASP
jgi:AraC-like DNA-binding protein